MTEIEFCILIDSDGDYAVGKDKDDAVRLESDSHWQQLTKDEKQQLCSFSESLHVKAETKGATP